MAASAARVPCATGGVRRGGVCPACRRGSMAGRDVARVRPRRHGDIDDSQEVHDEIREVGAQIKQQVTARYMQGHGEAGVLEGLRMHGAAPGAQKLMNNEMVAALWSIEQGVYVTFRSSTGTDCCRIGPDTKCFCGHTLLEHNIRNPRKPSCAGCACARYQYVPTRPEEIGFGHLCRRKEFDIHQWSPGCRCKHGSRDHSGVGSRKCKKCACFSYESDWACIVCDRKWEDHTTEIETEAERRADARPVGDAYKPLASVDQEFSDLVFGRKDSRGVHVLPAPTLHQQQIKRPHPSSQKRVSAASSTGSRGGGSRATRPALPAGPSLGAPAPGPGAGADACPCGAPYKTERAKFCSQCGAPRAPRPLFE